jgi:predicted Zn-dependent protease
MAGLPESVRIDLDRAGSLPDWKAYAERLGTNEWDDYRVNHTLRVLFGVPFMKRTNPAAYEKFEANCKQVENRMTPAVREAAREWQSFRPHAGGLRPLTGMVARVLLRENKPAEAERLYAIAQRQVPDYTSWYLEYVYFTLACRQQVHGRLTDEDLEEANRAIAQGRFLLRRGYSQTGMTERYVGRLHQLRGEWRESIEPLLAARGRLAGTDFVACDQAIVQAYLKVGDVAAARRIVDQGRRNAGRLANAYTAMAAAIDAAGSTAVPDP